MRNPNYFKSLCEFNFLEEKNFEPYTDKKYKTIIFVGGRIGGEVKTRAFRVS